MPYLFKWEEYDHREIKWAADDINGNPMNEEAAFKGIHRPSKIPEKNTGLSNLGSSANIRHCQILDLQVLLAL